MQVARLLGGVTKVKPVYFPETKKESKQKLPALLRKDTTSASKKTPK